jgi:hypothetical protein
MPPVQAIKVAPIPRKNTLCRLDGSELGSQGTAARQPLRSRPMGVLSAAMNEPKNINAARMSKAAPATLGSLPGAGLTYVRSASYLGTRRRLVEEGFQLGAPA